MNSTTNINEAILIWIGNSNTPWPNRDDDSIKRIYGAQASKVLCILKQLEREFYESNAYVNASDLIEMSSIAVADFKLKHPEINNDAVMAFARCYTYDFK